MIQLSDKDFIKVANIVQSKNELSVLSVIHGNLPGKIYVNDYANPTTALIRTCECNLIAGDSTDELFNSQVSSELDFWDPLTPDTSEWNAKVPTLHKNPFIKEYKRRRYKLSISEFIECNNPLNEGYSLKKAELSFLKQCNYENADKLIEWIENWGNGKIQDNFEKNGAGYFIYKDNQIVSWCLSDCFFHKNIAIGIHTDESFRKNGLGKLVVSATIKDCWAKGYENIEWLCVDTNKGSIAIAEKLGFQLTNTYTAFSSYPPIENIMDLTEAEWQEWGEYLEHASKTHIDLIWESLFSYIKSNDVEKTIEIMTIMKHRSMDIDYRRFKDYIISLQSQNLCSNFTKESWTNFITENMTCNA